jgi:hypothetical protein
MTDLTIKSKIYSIVGTTDERTTCECCGRTGLKGTVVLRPADGGGEVFFGSGCAAKASGWAKKDVDSAAKQAVAQAKADRKAAKVAATAPLWEQYFIATRTLQAALAGDDQTAIDTANTTVDAAHRAIFSAERAFDAGYGQ